MLPSAYRVLPSPCCKFLTNQPQQMSPQTVTILPLPFFTPAFHQPQYFSCLVGSSQSPIPSLRSLAQLPEQQAPDAQKQFPGPFLSPFLNCPSYLSPEPKIQVPSPSKTSFFQPPKYTSSLGYQKIPLPCLTRFSFWIYPMYLPPSGQFSSTILGSRALVFGSRRVATNLLTSESFVVLRVELDMSVINFYFIVRGTECHSYINQVAIGVVLILAIVADRQIQRHSPDYKLETRLMISKRGHLIALNKLPEFTLADEHGRHKIMEFESIRLPELRNFEGDVLAFHLLKRFLNQPIDYQISKKAPNKCKLYDIDGTLLALELVKKAAAVIDTVELSGTSLYTPEEIEKLKAIVPEKTEQICNAVLHPSLIPSLCDHFDNESCELVGLDDKVVVCKDKTYVSVGLANINCNFDIAEDEEINSFLLKYSKIKVSFGRPYYSIETERYCIDGVFPLKMEQQILSRGWGVLTNAAQFQLEDNEYQLLSSASSKAIKQFKGIWDNPVDLFSMTHVKENFLAKVVQVDQGNVFLIKNLANGELVTIEVDGVICPMNEEIGAFEAREFSRKQALGREFNVYIKKQLGFKSQASLVRVEDNQRYDKLLVGNGWARLEEGKSTNDVQFSRFLELQRKFMDTKSGIFSNKLGKTHFQDLTNIKNKDTKERLSALADRFVQLSNIQQSVEISGVIVKSRVNDIFTVRLSQFKILVNFKLQGVESLRCKLTLKEYKDFKEYSHNFLRENLYQRDVKLELIDFDSKQGCFIGFMQLLDGKDAAQMLLSAGLVFAESSELESRMYAKCQEEAKTEQIGLWHPVLYKLKSNKQISFDDEPFVATISEVVDGNTIYYQTAEALAKLENTVNVILSKQDELPTLSKDNFKVGNMCAARFTDGLLYRARIISRKKKSVNSCTIIFVDYGNSMAGNREQLYELPQELMPIEDLATKSRLALVKKLNTRSQVGETCHNEICNTILSKQYFLVPAGQDSMFLFHKSGDSNIFKSVNVELISSGLAKSLYSDYYLIDEGEETTLRNIQTIVKKDQKLKFNIWLDEEEEYEIKKQKGDDIL